jgi:hypothetical protein
LRFYASHWIGLPAISAAKLSLVGSLYQHQFHALLALLADRRIGLDLWHNERPWIRRERKTLSHRWLPMAGGDETSMELPLDRLLFNIAHFQKKLTDGYSIASPFDSNCAKIKIGHCENQIRPLKHKTGQYQHPKKNILRTKNK